MQEEVITWKTIIWSNPSVHSIHCILILPRVYLMQGKVTVYIKPNRFFQRPNKCWIICLSRCRSWQCLCTCQEKACNLKLCLPGKTKFSSAADCELWISGFCTTHKYKMPKDGFFNKQLKCCTELEHEQTYKNLQHATERGIL